MVFSIKKFFEKHIQPTSDKTEKVSEHAIKVATAALLIEMMRADGKVSDDERKAVMQTIQSKFNLTDDETKSLKELAKEKIRKAADYYEFTSLIHKGLSYEQKVEIIEHLWEIALTDEHLDKHEEYVVRKIADLIYVEHKDFIEAKIRVKKKLLL
ncbi:MAG TPA: TerB family tellurite resistance protein [Desulfosporosinus sp.]|nr:TerB family tellurite resistance protein [Desulfosporosinus sp.]